MTGREQAGPAVLVRQPRDPGRGGSAPRRSGAGPGERGRAVAKGREGWRPAGPEACEWGCAKGRQRTPEGTKGQGACTATRPSPGRARGARGLAGTSARAPGDGVDQAGALAACGLQFTPRHAGTRTRTRHTEASTPACVHTCTHHSHASTQAHAPHMRAHHTRRTHRHVYIHTRTHMNTRVHTQACINVRAHV